MILDGFQPLKGCAPARPSGLSLIGRREIRFALICVQCRLGIEIDLQGAGKVAFRRCGREGQRIDLKFASPKTVEQFVEAVASFNGPFLVIDSHAAHEDGDVPGGLIIDGAPFDVWSLAGKIPMPPIVILSACDTHPFDRNHATVANGFLACGAIAVVATALPIRAPQAARFVMRLINRAVHYGDILNGMGRAVPWTHIVGGVLRMELATDIIRTFHRKGHFDEKTRADLLLQTNMDLNPLKPSWYERMTERVLAACEPAPANFERELADIIAASDAIRYLHLGNPESIMIADHRATTQALGQAGLLTPSKHPADCN